MTTLNEIEIGALREALDDEYLSWETYDQVIKDFGEVRPFINIRDAEGRHINALLTLFARYDVPVPPNAWVGRVERFPNIEAACHAAVAGEIANGEMYERLLKLTDRQDILTVLSNLQEASQQRHLPAFQRCAQRGEQSGEKGQGHGGQGMGGRGKCRD
jgi:hypothetical protein